MDYKKEPDNTKKHHAKGAAERATDSLLKQYAKENKMFLTEAERALWNLLKAKSIAGAFKQQHIIGDYIADFANLRYKIVVEVDGKYHFKGELPIDDATRMADLNRMGYTVVRFTNDEILHHPGLVVNQIKDIIKHVEISYPKPSNPKENTSTSASSRQEQPHVLPGVGQGVSCNRTSPASCGAKGGAVAAKLPLPPDVRSNAWAVDAACSGNPGPMEYQGIDLQTGERVFHFGPMHGTNNIGEFLAIVHALALMEQRGIKDKAIYSDSYNAQLWVRKKQCKTKMERNANTEQLFQLIARAEKWLKTHPVTVPILDWNTKKWGECPADFGRK